MPVIPKLPEGLPEKYTSPNTSGLKVVVKTGEDNQFDFKITSEEK